MVSLSSLRTKIANKVFSSDLASTATLAALTSSSTDKWGDEQSGFAAGTSIDIVPFLYISSERSYQPFGDLQVGQSDFVVKHDVTVNPKDRITFNSVNYTVEQVDKSAYLDGGLVVQIIRVVEDA